MSEGEKLFKEFKCNYISLGIFNPLTDNIKNYIDIIKKQQMSTLGVITVSLNNKNFQCQNLSHPTH